VPAGTSAIPLPELNMDSSGETYKKFTIQAKRGIKGEAFFESLVSDYCIPHHITGPKDVGLDYICEWVWGDRPTGRLFAVQVKTFSEENAKPEHVGFELALNGLETFRIRNEHLKIDDRTLDYWRGLGLPVHLFVVVQGPAVPAAVGAAASPCPALTSSAPKPA
jgi:hypothetical protein